MRWVFVLGVLILFQTPRPLALVPLLTDEDVARALRIAGSTDTERAAFHAPYLIRSDDPLVERLDVVTESRRFVLAAEEQLRLGNWMVARGATDESGRTLRDTLRPTRGQVSVRARFRFHPQNTYANLPIIHLFLGQPTLLAISTTSAPHFAPERGEPAARPIILGGSVETFFNAPSIGSEPLPVRVVMDDREIVRASFDFSRVE